MGKWSCYIIRYCKWPFKQTKACLWKHCFPPCSTWIYHTDGIWLTEKQSLPWQSSYTIVVTWSLPVSPHRLSYVLISGLSSPSSSSSGRSNRYDTIYTHTRLCDCIFCTTQCYTLKVCMCVCVCLYHLCVSHAGCSNQSLLHCLAPACPLLSTAGSTTPLRPL